MSETDYIDYAVAQSEDFAVFAYPELLDSAETAKELWAYCLRIENNSDRRIRLLQRDFCITDYHGKNYFDCSRGFHGELPDLEPGEYFDFEDTTVINGKAAVLYGFCLAEDEQGNHLKIKLPIMQLSSALSADKNNLH